MGTSPPILSDLDHRSVRRRVIRAFYFESAELFEIFLKRARPIALLEIVASQPSCLKVGFNRVRLLYELAIRKRGPVYCGR